MEARGESGIYAARKKYSLWKDMREDDVVQHNHSHHNKVE